MDQADQFIATAKLIPPVAAIDLLGIDRMVVLVEPQHLRALVPGVVRHEEVAGISHQESFRIEQLQGAQAPGNLRSEEHTSELQSRLHLVCRLLLEKKNASEREYQL